jgi:hypothetical protein
MPGLTSGQASHGFVRSALMLSACVLAIALALMPLAIQQHGSSGAFGLVIAGAICLISGLAAEWLSCFLTRNSSPLAGQLSGMMLRMLLPLVVCLVLAVQGYSGRENLAFVCYLLTFYTATLALETWLAVKRAGALSRLPNQGSR